jgi:hypothetical protein
MDARAGGRLLRRTGLSPPVRAAHSQLEVDFLPPYGDPEVHIPGEVATYLVAGGLAAAVVDHLDREG